MNFVTWSIRNPVPVIVIFVALTVAGLVSFAKLGVQDRPDIELPAVIVTIAYPGVPPSQLECEVTRKIEDAVATVTGIEHIHSIVNEGVSTTSIQFRFERDLNEAVDEVRDAVTRIRADLPADAREPVISRVTTAGQPRRHVQRRVAEHERHRAVVVRRPHGDARADCGERRRQRAGASAA